jgi:1,4-dihydroxy-2-naphthoyl-CoA synthase
MAYLAKDGRQKKKRENFSFWGVITPLKAMDMGMSKCCIPHDRLEATFLRGGRRKF